MLPSISSGRGAFGNVLKKVLVQSSSRLQLPARQFASVVPSSPPANGATRPHLNIPVKPNHGLWGFFRKAEDGRYETLEAREATKVESGRSWRAAELRRKSFKDLHTLWYVLLRERNLLATQKEEARRLGVDAMRTLYVVRVHKVRKSMARIKYIINERRLAYEGAVNILVEQKEAKLSARRLRREARAKAEAAKVAKAALDAQKVQAAEESAEGKAADMAAAGLFQHVGVSQGDSTGGQEKQA